MRDAELKLLILRDLLVRHYVTVSDVWLEIENTFCWNCSKRINGNCPMEDGKACEATPEEEIDKYLEIMLKEMKREK